MSEIVELTCVLATALASAAAVARAAKWTEPYSEQNVRLLSMLCFPVSQIVELGCVLAAALASAVAAAATLST